MLNSQEIYELLKNTTQGYLKPDDILFTTSNCKLLQTYKKLGTISNKEDETSNENVSYGPNKIFCNVFGCIAVFDNVSSYQSHYNAMHRFICKECKKSLPTDHLLDLHISENHDSYFMARVERGERLFKCYLEECKDLFKNPYERKEHCMKQHKFPSNFRFDQLANENYVKRGTCGKGTNAQEPEDMKIISHQNRGLKIISFGHQKEKTFCAAAVQSQKSGAGKTLVDMNTLSQVLDMM